MDDKCVVPIHSRGNNKWLLRFLIPNSGYMQYLLGLPKFTEKPVFVPELFVQIRKRLDHEFFNLLTLLLSEADGSKPKKVHTDEDGNDHGGDDEGRCHML